MLRENRRLKTLITLFLLTALTSSAVLTFGIVRVAASETARAYVDPPEITYRALVPGTSFNASAKIDNIPADPGIAGIQFKLTFDPTILNVQLLEDVVFHNVTPPSEWYNIWQLQNIIDNTAGVVSYAYTWQDINLAIANGYCPISGNHTVANIVFNVTGIGECVLHFRVLKLGDSNAQPVPCDSTDGYFNNIQPPMPELTIRVDPPKTENGSLKIGSIFNISVNMDSNTPHQGVVGLQFNLTWDPTVLDAVGMTEIMFHEVTPFSELSNIWQIMHKINNSGGYLVYAYAFMDLKTAISAGYAPIMGNHTLTSIAFRVKDIATTGLNLTSCKAGDKFGNALAVETIDGVFKGSNVIPGDLNLDGIVDISDAIIASNAFGSSPGNPRWNALVDLDENGIIDIFDMIILAANFGYGR